MPIIFQTLDLLINPLVKYVGGKRFKRQEIAKNVRTTPDWTEFLIEPPVKIKKQVQHISLGIKCHHNVNQEDFFSCLADGTIINPEIQIIDEFENTYKLEGRIAEVSHHKDDTDIFVAHSLGFSSYPDKLPSDKRYTKIKSRNEQPFTCPSINWVDFDLK